MKMFNPFKKKDKEEQIIKEQREHEKETQVLANVTNPQGTDEAFILERQARYAELRRWQQDRSPQNQKLFEKLCGHSFRGNELVKMEKIKPLMNINGAYQIINFLETLDVNLIMSNYSDLRINLALRYGVGYPIIQFIKDNYQELGIEKNFGKLRYILNIIFNSVEPTFYRALNAGERGLDAKIYKVVRTEDATKKEERKGVF